MIRQQVYDYAEIVLADVQNLKIDERKKCFGLSSKAIDVLGVFHTHASLFFNTSHLRLFSVI